MITMKEIIDKHVQKFGLMHPRDMEEFRRCFKIKFDHFTVTIGTPVVEGSSYVYPIDFDCGKSDIYPEHFEKFYKDGSTIKFTVGDKLVVGKVRIVQGKTKWGLRCYITIDSPNNNFGNSDIGRVNIPVPQQSGVNLPKPKKQESVEMEEIWKPTEKERVLAKKLKDIFAKIEEKFNMTDELTDSTIIHNGFGWAVVSQHDTQSKGMGYNDTFGCLEKTLSGVSECLEVSQFRRNNGLEAYDATAYAIPSPTSASIENLIEYWTKLATGNFSKTAPRPEDPFAALAVDMEKATADAHAVLIKVQPAWLRDALFAEAYRRVTEDDMPKNAVVKKAKVKAKTKVKVKVAEVKSDALLDNTIVELLTIVKPFEQKWLRKAILNKAFQGKSDKNPDYTTNLKPCYTDRPQYMGLNFEGGI